MITMNFIFDIASFLLIVGMKVNIQPSSCEVCKFAIFRDWSVVPEWVK